MGSNQKSVNHHVFRCVKIFDFLTERFLKEVYFRKVCIIEFYSELMEETGITSSDINIDPNFRFEEVYYPTYKRFGGERVKKTLVIFLARLKSDDVDVKICLFPIDIILILFFFLKRLN